MFDDLLELKTKFGLTAAELGIHEEFMFSYQTKGRFFDYDCECYLDFDGNKIFTGYSLCVSGAESDKIIDKMNDFCSGPVSSEMIPFVSSNGGAVYKTVYEDKDAIITVSKAQMHSYYTVKIKPNPNPGYFGTLVLKPAEFKGFAPKEVEAAAVGYDNGILTVRVDNHTDAPFVCSDDFTLFERKDASYYGKFKKGPLLLSAAAYTILPGESADVKLDLRLFGKPVPNEYLVRFAGLELYFLLADDGKNG